VERRLLSTLRPGQIYRPEVEWISLPFPFLSPSSNGAERDRHASRKKALLLPGEAEGRGEEFLDGGNGGALRSGFGPHGGAEPHARIATGRQRPGRAVDGDTRGPFDKIAAGAVLDAGENEMDGAGAAIAEGCDRGRRRAGGEADEGEPESPGAASGGATPGESWTRLYGLGRAPQDARSECGGRMGKCQPA